ncbi:hypothetical protein [Streptomyces liangshanensis]|uniref:hypothetical protein n=1 Tax=Streptomyces liangshanensis TaxID=2717324 RepID=UPI0036DF9BE9
MNPHLSVQASDAASGFNSIAVLFILLLGLLLVICLIGYLGSALTHRKESSLGHRLWLRAGAVLSTCAAICVYLWGALHVAFMEDLNMRQACVAAGGETKASQVDGYEASYLPLRFVCHIGGGGSYSAAVPSWINPALGILLPLALITGVTSAVTREDLRRSAAPSPQQPPSSEKGNT